MLVSTKACLSNIGTAHSNIKILAINVKFHYTKQTRKKRTVHAQFQMR